MHTLFLCTILSLPPAPPPPPPPAAEGGTRSRHTVVQRDGSRSPRTVEIRVENGRVVATVDGEEISADRLRLEDGVVVIAEGDAAVRGRRAAIAVEESAAARRALDAAGGIAAAAPAAEPPRAMIGLRFVEPDAALVRQLGLKAGSATLVEEVIPDLPADKAGIEPFDVIVAVDEDAAADPDSIRKAIAAREAGATLEFTVRRAGETFDVTVTLEAYDPARIAGDETIVREWHARIPGFENLMERFDVDSLDIEPYLDALRNRIRVAPLPDGDDFVFEIAPAPPAPPAPPGPRGGREMGPGAPGLPPVAAARMQEHLERIEARLDELSKRLDRLLERLEARE